MNYLQQFKYSKDDPEEFGINPNLNKNDNKSFDDHHLSNLLSRSIRVEKEIFLIEFFYYFFSTISGPLSQRLKFCVVNLERKRLYIDIR